VAGTPDGVLAAAQQDGQLSAGIDLDRLADRLNGAVDALIRAAEG